MFTEDSHVTAYLVQSRQGMLQQREAVQGDSGFVLAHTRALTACKNKTGELGVNHRHDSSVWPVKTKSQRREARKRNPSSFAAITIPGSVRLPRREATAR